MKSFIDYLTEVTIEVDPNDPVAAQAAAKMAARQGEQRTAMQQREVAKAEQQAAQATGQDQDPDIKRLMALKQQVHMLEIKIARKKGMEQPQA